MSVDRDLMEHLARFVTDERRKRMAEVLEERTRYITVAVEDIFQPHNASAVLRTCDCFGVQDVHIIENRNRYRVNPGVELGTAQWLTLHRYADGEDNTTLAIGSLKEAGYRVVATSPHTRQQTLDEIDLDKGPIALMFGTEMQGLSRQALDLADEYLAIPMYGFVESFNISVSAAIILHHLSRVLRSSGIDYRIGAREREAIMMTWLRSSIGRVEAIEREYYARKGEDTCT